MFRVNIVPRQAVREDICSKLSLELELSVFVKCSRALPSNSLFLLCFCAEKFAVIVVRVVYIIYVMYTCFRNEMGISRSRTVCNVCYTALFAIT